MRTLQIVLSAIAIIFSSFAHAAESRIAFKIDYRHKQVHVRSNVQASSGETVTLTSEPSSKTKWALAMTPRRTAEGDLLIVVRAEENGEIKQEAKLTISAGESATVMSERPDGNIEMTVTSQPSGQTPATKTLIMRLQNADLAATADAVEDLLAEAIERDVRVRVQIDGRANAVVVDAETEDLKRARELMERLDSNEADPSPAL